MFASESFDSVLFSLVEGKSSHRAEKVVPGHSG